MTASTSPVPRAAVKARNSVVIYAGDGLKDFGNTVLARHENRLVTVYGHASERVKRGEKGQTRAESPVPA